MFKILVSVNLRLLWPLSLGSNRSCKINFTAFFEASPKLFRFSEVKLKCPKSLGCWYMRWHICFWSASDLYWKENRIGKYWKGHQPSLIFPAQLLQRNTERKTERNIARNTEILMKYWKGHQPSFFFLAPAKKFSPLVQREGKLVHGFQVDFKQLWWMQLHIQHLSGH